MRNRIVGHTGGEWYLEEDSGLILSIPEGKDSPVCVASVGGSEEPLTPKPVREMLANAHLIAAAPDMCEALKEIRQTLVVLGYSDDSWSMGVVDKALAKAEGK